MPVRTTMHSAVLDDLNRFSKTDRTRIVSAIKKIETNPDTPGLRQHKVGNGFVSFSPSMGIRIIGKRMGGTIALLHVGQHDAAYQWAENHKAATGDHGLLELFPVAIQDPREEMDQLPVEGYGHQLGLRLENIGVPPKILTEVKPSRDEADLLERISLMSEEWQELVMAAAVGEELGHEDVPIGSSRVTTISDDPQLAAALEMPVEKWRAFLHPRQREVVKCEDRLVSVSGGPGTGKTVVIAHRAVQMARRLHQDEVVVVLGLSVTLVSLLADTINELTPKESFANRRIWPMALDSVRGYRPANVKPTTRPNANAWITIEGGACFLVSDRWTKRIGAILIDEAHDCPAWFLDFLNEAACDTDCDQIVVAHDRNQTIYPQKDTGDSLESFLDGSTEFDLPFCFRMSKPLLDNALNILGRYMLDLPSELIRAQSLALPVAALQGPAVEYLAVDSLDEMVAKARESVINLRQKYEKKEIAVVHLQFSSPHFKRKGRVDKVTEALNLDTVVKEHYKFAFWVKGLEFFAGVIVCPANFIQRDLAPRDLLFRLNTMYVAMTRFRNELQVIYAKDAPAARYFPTR